MKKSILSALVALITLAGCKKGPEDPLVSVRTRKDRLCNDWTLLQGESEQLRSSRSSTIVSTILSHSYLSKDSIIQKITILGETSRDARGHRNSMQLFKDGNYIKTIRYHSVSRDTITSGFNPETFEEFRYDAIYDSLITIEYTGVWDFTGRTNDHKAKEKLLFTSKNIKTSTETSVVYRALDGAPEKSESKNASFDLTSSEDGNCEAWMIVALWDKKLVIERSLDSSYTKWVDGKFPTAIRVTGSERIEFTND